MQHGVRASLAVLLVRILVSGVLVTAATAKFVAPADLASVSEEAPSIIGVLNSGTAHYGASFVELMIAITVLSSRWRLGLGLVVVLCAGFMAFLVAVQVAEPSLNGCGCFGSYRMSNRSHVALVCGLALAALGGLFSSNRVHATE